MTYGGRRGSLSYTRIRARPTAVGPVKVYKGLDSVVDPTDGRSLDRTGGNSHVTSCLSRGRLPIVFERLQAYMHDERDDRRSCRLPRLPSPKSRPSVGCGGRRYCAAGRYRFPFSTRSATCRKQNVRPYRADERHPRLVSRPQLGGAERFFDRAARFPGMLDVLRAMSPRHPQTPASFRPGAPAPICNKGEAPDIGRVRTRADR
jgi:hypothetical protein